MNDSEVSYLHSLAADYLYDRTGHYHVLIGRRWFPVLMLVETLVTGVMVRRTVPSKPPNP